MSNESLDGVMKTGSDGGEVAFAIDRERAQQLNPFIGVSPAETMTNVAAAIAAASMFPEADEAGQVCDSIAWARGTFQQVAKVALEWEAAQTQARAG